LTHEREIISSMAHRGFWICPALGLSMTRSSWFDAPRLGIVLALVGNLIALALWTPARTAPRLPWVELAFALVLMLVTVPPLALRAFAHAKRGIWGIEFTALVAAFVSLVVGMLGLLVGGGTILLTPNFLLRFGSRPDGASAIAFEAAGAIVGFAFLANHMHQSAVRKAFTDAHRAMRTRYTRMRRVMPKGGDAFVPYAVLSPGDRLRLMAGEVALVDMRLDAAARVTATTGCLEDRSPGQLLFRGERLMSVCATGRIEYMPRVDSFAAADATVARETCRIERLSLRREGDRFESMAALALLIASVWFALFAVIVHAISGRHALHPGVLLAGVAVLAGASPAAFVVGLPLARVVAVMRAHAAGIVIKDVSALEALASVDFAFFDLADPVRPDALHAFRALWHRSIACRLISGDRTDAALALGHRFGVATTGDLGPEEKARVIRATREAGGRVLHVSHNDTARMIPVDVSIAIAPEAFPDDVAAPILLRDPNLTSLVWLVDTARILRSRRRLILALTLGYDAIVVPLCVAGFLAPISAAALSFGLTVLTCLLASRVVAKRRRWFFRDKLVPAQMPAFPRGS
jgi:cation transport ATPase